MQPPAYVGPYSPQAYNAASILANGGSAAPYAPGIIQAGQAINQAQPAAGGTGGGGTAGSTTSGGDPNLLNSLISQVQALNQNYATLYGAAGGGTGNGAYGQGVQSLENTLQGGYIPQFQQVGLQAGQDANQLANIMSARGIGSSSFAGTQEQNLGANAQNQDAAITANYQKDLLNLENQTESQQAKDVAQQKAINTSLNTLESTTPQMSPDLAAYAIQNSIGNVQNAGVNIAGELATAQSPQGLAGQFQNLAPSQVMTPQAIQSALSGIGSSSLPTYLQNQVGSALVNANSLTPGDANYWLNYLQNYTPSFS